MKKNGLGGGHRGLGIRWVLTDGYICSQQQHTLVL